MWQVCSDVKVTALPLVLQGGFTKYCCFLCLWDSRDTGNHYLEQDWPEQKKFAVGERNVRSRDSSVSIVSDYGLDDRGSFPGKSKGFFL
jgi:hypothetical protein